jgi:type VI secretion system protein ImpB
MGKESTVAPKERINLVYKPATGDAQEEVELPLKILMVGDYTGRTDARPIEERAPINVDKSNFDEVMAKQELGVTLSVPDRLSGAKDSTLAVSLKFEKLSDFGPESLVHQVPELKALLELRSTLHALKGPIGNVPAFRKKIESLLKDPAQRQRLLAELGLSGSDGNTQAGD